MRTLNPTCLVMFALMAGGSSHAEAQEVKQAAMASFQGKPITEEDVRRAAADDLDKLEMQRLQFNASYERGKHQIMEAALSRIIEDKVLTAEAASRGITKEQLLGRELQGKVKDPTLADINAYYEANKQRIGKPKEGVSTQIEEYLRRQNYDRAKAELVDRLKSSYGVKVALEPLRTEIDTAGKPSRGPQEAPVTIVEFSDFQCPYCAGLSSILDQVLRKYDGRVRLVYMNFPLTQIHPAAEKAAQASLCASDQDRFWEMHDLLFQARGRLSDEAITEMAARLQLDRQAFSSCLGSGRHAARVKRDLREGIAAGVTGTPTIFINGRFLQGARSVEDVARVIEEEIQSQAGRSVQSSASARN